MRSKMREMLGEKVQLKLITPKKGLFGRHLRDVFARGARDTADTGFTVPSLADDVISAVEARSLWSRFGL